ncbi:DUF551 domain-containing protein [Enterobacter roggenkampii]|uniref:DUF551 domain-containing protein n=1 Tax=Enterobacter roggenkampii TaxID=1812935 RepID=UPI001BCBE613|nr:DUF551 domain-containing protein [Enterobacter roggenkampii]
MSTITREQAKDLRNAFQCWQQDYDPVEDREQYDMFGLGVVAMDALLASLETEPLHEATDWQVDQCVTRMESEGDMVLVPRGLLGAALGAIRHPKHESGVTMGALRHYAYKSKRAAPPAPVSVPDDYFTSLVAAARVRADKAMRKFPQPNYVLNKVAEESGEVIKAVIHFTEGREEWRNVEGEIIDNLAMLIRLVMEGDQVIGFTPPDACRAAMLQGADGNSPVIPDGWVACSERMPSAGEQVLAYRPDAPESNDPLIKMATYVGGSAHGHGFDCYCKPTHWMPLPAAPQQEVMP